MKKLNLSRRLLTTLLAGVAVLLLSGCGQEGPEGQADAQDEGDVTELTVGISPFQDTLLPILGNEWGWYEEENLEVTFSTLEWGSIIPAAASGEVDVAVNNTTGVVSAAHRQPELRYWYGWNPFTEGAAIMVRPDTGMRTVDEFMEEDDLSEDEAVDAALSQLEGREIVTTMGTDMGKNVLVALAKVDLGQEDVAIRDLDPDSGLAAFLGGTGDAYLGGIPQRSKARDEGMKVLASGPQLATPPINGLVTTSSFAEENEDALLRFLHVIFRIMDRCDNETAECAEIITKEIREQTGDDMSVDDFEVYWSEWEDFATGPEDVEEWILSEDGFAYWQDTWDEDNQFLHEETGDIPEPAGYEHFMGDEVHDAYLERYGE